MAKDKSSTDAGKLSKEERKAARKAEKKGAKLAAAADSSSAGVTKVKADKKEKKKDKESRKALAEKAINELDSSKVDGEESEDAEDPDVEMGEDENEAVAADKVPAARPIGALVPFANPLADDKVAKKVFKCVKKSAAQRMLKRGVKEVVKALRKSPAARPIGPGSLPQGIVILAADISPMDVISHIPVLAEDHGIPYIYVTSRAELGTAGQTKRPTSVVLVSREGGKKAGGAADKKDKDKKDDDGESWDETFKGLVKVVEREGRHVKV